MSNFVSLLALELAADRPINDSNLGSNWTAKCLVSTQIEGKSTDPQLNLILFNSFDLFHKPNFGVFVFFISFLVSVRRSNFRAFDEEQLETVCRLILGCLFNLILLNFHLI